VHVGFLLFSLYITKNSKETHRLFPAEIAHHNRDNPYSIVLCQTMSDSAVSTSRTGERISRPYLAVLLSGAKQSSFEKSLQSKSFKRRKEGCNISF